MIKRTKMVLPLSMMLGVSVVLSACQAGQGVTATEIVQKVRETMKTTQSVEATMDLSLDINKEGIKTLVEGFMPAGKREGMDAGDHLDKLPDAASASLKVWKQSPDKLRVEVVTTNPAGGAGAALVYDGRMFYAYEPKGNTVYKGTPSEMLKDMPGELDAMMGAANFEQELDKALAATDIKLAGEEKVAGFDAYKLDMAPKPDAAELLGIPEAFKMQAGVLIKDARSSLWVDKTSWMPLKMTVEHPNIGKFTYEAKSLQVNGAIDASRFVLQVPAGAKVVDLDEMHKQMSKTMQPKQMTITEAQAAAQADGWKLLEPAYVADNATLVGVSQVMGGKHMEKSAGLAVYMLNYSSPKLDFSITQAKTQIEKGLGDDYSGLNGRPGMGNEVLKTVTVRGVEGKAFSPDGAGWTSLMWQEKGSNLYVAVRGKLSLDEALKVAESLK